MSKKTKPSSVALAKMSSQQKAEVNNLAAFLKTHPITPSIPDIKGLLERMRAAASAGVALPKGLRIYKRPDGAYGVVSGKADLADQAKFARSLAFRKVYEVVSEDGLFATFRIYDYQMKDEASGKWVSPKWTSSPEDRQASAVQWAERMASIADEVESF